MATFSGFTLVIFPHYVFLINKNQPTIFLLADLIDSIELVGLWLHVYWVRHIKLMSAGRSSLPPEVQLLSASTAEVTKILLRVNISQATQSDYLPSFVLKMCQSAGRCNYWHFEHITVMGKYCHQCGSRPNSNHYDNQYQEKIHQQTTTLCSMLIKPKHECCWGQAGVKKNVRKSSHAFKLMLWGPWVHV